VEGVASGKDSLSANHLVAVVFHGEGFERRLDEATTETED